MPAEEARIDAGYRLVYVLMPDRRDRLPRLHLCKARLRKDGSIGGATLQTDFYSLLALRPGYVRPDDEEPIRLLAALRAGSMYTDDIKPAGRLGARLLDQLCAEGRLLWAESSADLKRGNLFEIRPGPPRHASLGWHADDPGGESLSLRRRFDDGAAPGHVLATEPARYVNDGVLGELVLPEQFVAVAPTALLSLVKEAPSLAPEQRAGMAARLVAQGLDRILPLPQVLQTRHRHDLSPTPHLLLDSCATVVRGELRWHDYALLYFGYDSVLTEGIDAPVLRRVVGDTVELIERDMPAERAAAAILAGLGFVARDTDPSLEALPDDALQLPTEAAWLAFARHELPRLRAAGWQVEIEGD
jgi:hypothetical protein